ncbi:unnamed protein product [Prunus armeniaca]|uniref:Uncharacterized protein n=1 Tax=Prunus armeniaca TaxID=36596 RepID=A0A6J5TZH8_PRUAR|nr:unnamed protein product [Prunus armeniaca]
MDGTVGTCMLWARGVAWEGKGCMNGWDSGDMCVVGQGSCMGRQVGTCVSWARGVAWEGKLGELQQLELASWVVGSASRTCGGGDNGIEGLGSGGCGDAMG